MIGLSAILAGLVSVRRESLVVEGAVGLAVLLAAAALIVGWLPPAAAVAIIVVVLVPYVTVLALGPLGVERLPIRGRGFLHRMFGEEHPRAPHEGAIMGSAPLRFTVPQKRLPAGGRC